MKKIKLILLSSLILLTACTNINTKNYSKKEKVEWKGIKGPFVMLDVQEGDIIIKEKELNPTGMFGHAAIMGTNTLVLDYPKVGEKSYAIDLNYWLEENRKFLILRYKDMNDVFRKKLVENIKKYFGESYKIHTDKMNTNGFYCSQYIWYVYYITAKELGIELDIDSDGGIFVFPYDFINSPSLEIVE